MENDFRAAPPAGPHRTETGWVRGVLAEARPLLLDEARCYEATTSFSLSSWTTSPHCTIL
jgi:hypothetical protein